MFAKVVGLGQIRAMGTLYMRQITWIFRVLIESPVFYVYGKVQGFSSCTWLDTVMYIESWLAVTGGETLETLNTLTMYHVYEKVQGFRSGHWLISYRDAGTRLTENPGMYHVYWKY